MLLVLGGLAVPARANAPATVTAPEPSVSVQRLRGVDSALVGKHAVIAASGTTARIVAAAEFTFAKPAELVSVTADAAFAYGSQVRVRVLESGKWSKWTELGVAEGHGPDRDSVEAAGARFGSDPLMTHNATAAQVKVATPSGKAPAGLNVTTVDAPQSAADAKVAQGQVRGASKASMPTILSRADWGANEAWRSRAPIYTGAIKVGFVHHTASTSNYTAAQTAAQIRAIYSYHTQSLKHSDIDYNYVVDKFGRIWEGRAGGIDETVLGGHTAGFNDNSFAAVALGNFMNSAGAPEDFAAMTDSMARLFAWKLGRYGVNPASTASVVSAGYSKPTRYAKGVTAQIPAMSSHQTVNYTDCPGDALQAVMPQMRALAASYSNVALSAPSPEVNEFVAGSRSALAVSSYTTKAVNWRLEVLSPCSDTALRIIDGATGAETPVSISWDLLDSSGATVLPATYTLRLTGTDSDGSAVAPVTSTVTITPGPGAGWGPCANVSRAAWGGAAATSVNLGQITAPGATSAVLVGDATLSTAALVPGVVAAPLAHKLAVPLLVTDPGYLSAEVGADLAARGVTAVTVVGNPDSVSDNVIAGLNALGIAAERVAGDSDAATAALVASRIGAAGSAVLIDPAQPGHALAGAALAAAQNVPVLIVNPSAVPAETLTALSSLGATAVTVAAGAAVSDEVLAAGLGGLPASRPTAGDDVTAAVTIAAAIPSQPAGAVLFADVAATWGAAPAAAATGYSLLFNPGTTLAGAVQTYFTGRPGLAKAYAATTVANLSDSVLGSVSRLLSGQDLGGTGSALPEATPVATATPSATPTAGVQGATLTATTTRKLSRANAAPEPVRKGKTITISAKLTAKYTDQQWRVAPSGIGYSLYFRAAGKKKYTKVGAGITQAGKVVAYAKATKSGYWRVKVGSKTSGADYVKVKK
ncbi:MAG: N-acetylmuramoyl-L-alanine amidase [Candidatus Nanopelagicales bacterium]